MAEQQVTHLAKRPTRIAGFDAISEGGLPTGGITLVQGDAGTGKTLFALQVLAHAVEAGENGLFLGFEERAPDVLRNVASLGWDLGRHLDQRLFMLDGRPPGQVEISGQFDIGGLLAVLSAMADRVDLSWVVLDGIDQLLALRRDLPLVASELLRLREWLRGRDISVLMTAKESQVGSYRMEYLEQLRFDLNTLITLSSKRCGQRISRRLRIAKYRGSAHVADEVPLLIGSGGVVLPYSTPQLADPAAASSERISTGVERLDRLLGGGYFRGSATLITGEPGTSKTSLAVAFAAAAAARGEKVLYISFDETASQIQRNMRSIGIELGPHQEAGRLVIVERRSWRALAETHFLNILEHLDAEQPDCVVVDPLSGLYQAGGDTSSYNTIERLMDLFKARGMTCVVTSLIENDARTDEASAAQVSTIADTWLALNYQIHEGERNRSLSVVKSRGTAHSNQVRELVLSATGIRLADVYTLGSRVLMGTARLHQEQLATREQELERQKQARRRRELEQQLHDVRERALQLEAELAGESDLLEAGEHQEQRQRHEIQRSRMSDNGVDRVENRGE